jgi:hypothetical protein
MSTWPTGWREHALRRADVPITQFALDILNLWEQATPTDRYTNNPLGAPAHGNSAPRALQGGYAQFPTMQAFYDAFMKAVHAGKGKPLLSALGANDSHAEAWRAINGLRWPANTTETDYPSTVLDKVVGNVPKSWGTKKPAERKTVGVEGATAAAQRNTAAQSAALHHAVNNINDASRAVEYLVRRLGQHG